MLSKEEFQRPRTPYELSQYVKKVYADVKGDKNIVKIARLKKNLYKQFIEELYPFSVFCNWKYPENNVLCELIIGNQGYDGIITLSTGEKEFIEITWPIDGQKKIQLARYMNKLLDIRTGNQNDIKEFEIRCETYDYNDLSKWKAVKDHVIEVAKNKALKDYTSTGGSSLVFLVDVEYLYFNRDDHNKELLDIVEQLKKIDYKVDSVYVILMPYEEILIIKEN